MNAESPMTTGRDDDRLREALAAREAELERLRQELDETNRGVVALYAELDERAEELRRASDSKSRFLSNVSHELRTPIASVINLGRLLLEEPLGTPLGPEHHRQLGYIVRAGESLLSMVTELLDLARIEAGKISVTPTPVLVADVMSSLRGMIRPLATRPEVVLEIEDCDPSLVIETDEGRLSQILRTLLTNAVKFTERGEVRATASLDDRGWVHFAVSDTGIGIAPQDQERIFQEFEQVAGPLQRRARGIGLGLPLSRQLARLLGGDLSLESARGMGSRFTLRLPPTPPAAPAAPTAAARPAASR